MRNIRSVTGRAGRIATGSDPRISLLFCAVAACLGLAAAAPAAGQQAVLLVRHAEKVDESAGSARAQALARSLASTGIEAIFVTQYKRTGLTAEPLAARLGLKDVAARPLLPQAARRAA